jgi:transposase
VAELARQAQAATGRNVTMAFVDQSYSGDTTAEAESIRISEIKLPTAKKGFVLLPRRWVVERCFGWAANTSASLSISPLTTGSPLLPAALPPFSSEVPDSL